MFKAIVTKRITPDALLIATNIEGYFSTRFVPNEMAGSDLIGIINWLYHGLRPQLFVFENSDGHWEVPHDQSKNIVSAIHAFTSDAVRYPEDGLIEAARGLLYSELPPTLKRKFNESKLDIIVFDYADGSLDMAKKLIDNGPC